MAMTRYDAYLAMAYFLRNELGYDVALMVQQDKILGVGIDLQGWSQDYATCIVNLLQGVVEVEMLRKADIYTTTAPTDMCMGMARMANVARIFYRSEDGAALVCDKPESSPPRTAIHITKADKVPVKDFSYWTAEDNTALGPFLGSLPDPWPGRARAASQAPRYGRAPHQAFPVAPPAPGEVWFASADEKELVYMLAIYAVVEQLWNRHTGPIERHHGHNIGSILTDAQGNIIAWGVNTNSQNLTRHGEVNAIKQYMHQNPKKALPDGCTLYTTLEPCYMCAAFIANCGTRVTVIYGQKDHAITNNSLERGVNHCTQRASKLHTLLGALNEDKLAKIQEFNALWGIKPKVDTKPNFDPGKRLLAQQTQMSPIGPQQQVQMMQTIKFLPTIEAWGTFENASETLFNLERQLKGNAREVWLYAVGLLKAVQSPKFSMDWI